MKDNFRRNGARQSRWWDRQQKTGASKNKMPYLAEFWGSRSACWRLFRFLSLGFHFSSPSHRLSRLGCSSNFLE